MISGFNMDHVGLPTMFLGLSEISPAALRVLEGLETLRAKSP